METLSFCPMSPRDAALLGALELAYIGDCVFELTVRTHVLSVYAGTMQELHGKTVKQVCAAGQAALAAKIEPLLTPEEHAVFRRGRNVRHRRIPKGSSPAEYAGATAFEALLGYLYLSGQTDRISALLKSAQFPLQ